MITAIVLALGLATPTSTPRDSWFGADKVKHFLVSAMIQSAAFSAARAAGASRPVAQAVGGVSVATIGVWKELRDRRDQKPFSPRDLSWDAAGALAAAALLNGTR